MKNSLLLIAASLLLGATQAHGEPDLTCQAIPLDGDQASFQVTIKWGETQPSGPFYQEQKATVSFQGLESDQPFNVLFKIGETSTRCELTHWKKAQIGDFAQIEFGTIHGNSCRRTEGHYARITLNPSSKDKTTYQLQCSPSSEEI